MSKDRKIKPFSPPSPPQGDPGGGSARNLARFREDRLQGVRVENMVISSARGINQDDNWFYEFFIM